MTKAAALALVQDAHNQYGDWTNPADYTALVNAATWADFMTALLANPLYREDSNAIQALKVTFFS